MDATRRPKRVVIAAGGTGGHFYPGLVLAQTLRRRGWEPLMLVRRGDPALAALEKEGIAAAELDMVGMPRRPGLGWLSFAWKLLKSLALADRIMRDFAPSAAVGMGGYLSLPCVLAAWRRGVPRAVHESNAVLGLANRLCAACGARLYWGLPPREAAGLVTGTPIRPALWKPLPAAEARRRLGLDPSRLTVLVFGGSQGARGLNRGVPAALRSAAERAVGGLQVLHLAGAKEAAEVRAAYGGGPLSAVVLEYLEDMNAAYSAADLVVCRAGASTLAELAAQRKPAILVPFPSAAANHQEANARGFEAAGACRVVLEERLSAELSPALGDLLISNGAAERLAAMARGYSKLALPAPERAAQSLADAVEGLLALSR